jgi:cytochrome c-type biogenesis protein
MTMWEVSGIGVATAFLAGLISFLSPCVLPLVPGYVSYVAGRSLDELQQRDLARANLSAVGLSLFFIMGFSAVFIALGASATALGQLLLEYRYEAGLVGGAIVIVFGLFMIGLVALPWLQRELRFRLDIKGGSPLGAFVLGLAFAFGWTPCIGPILGGILTVSASSAQAANGVLLLSIYSLGLGVPFLAAAAFTGTFFAKFKAIRRIGRPLQVAAGVVMVIMGVAIMTGNLSAFSFWLLKTFPGLAKIG